MKHKVMTVSYVCFYSVMHAMQDAQEKRLISRSDLIPLKHHEEPTSQSFLSRKYWINLSEIWFGSCLNTYLDVSEISKD